MKGLLKGLARLTILFIVLGILIIIVGLWLIRKPWAPTEGTLELSGLQRSVEIIRDSSGVPHLYAENETDLFFAQGYTHAQDRLWQMEFFRRMGKGKISEVLGPAGIKMDQFYLNLRLHDSAKKAWKQLDAESQKILEDYTRGINAYLDVYQETDLPLEFSLLSYFSEINLQPEPWTSIDVLTYGNLIAFQMSGNRKLEEIRSMLIEHLKKEQENLILDLFPHFPKGSPLTIPQSQKSYQGLNEVEAKFIPKLDELLGTPLQGIGSNAWVVSGKYTQSGSPLLANDLHLGATYPSPWYANGLHAGRFNVVGYSLAGIPGVITGHNEKIAWGITNLAPDTQDYYLEKLDDLNSPTKYEYKGKWLDLKKEQAEIHLFGGGSISFPLYFTRHGPILQDSLADGNPKSIRWTTYEGNLFFQAVKNLNLATNWREFRKALRSWESPGQNFLYADRKGNIGYQATGKIPIRASKHEGSIPVSGWEDNYEWEGYIPYEKLPSIYNPLAGYIISANQPVVGKEYPYRLADHYAPGIRATRIENLIKELAPLSVDDMHQIQMDTYSIPASKLTSYLKKKLQSKTDLEAQALISLKNWDFHYEVKQIAPTIYEAWQEIFLKKLLRDDLGEDFTAQYLAGDYAQNIQQYWPWLLQLIEEEKHPWIDDQDTPNKKEELKDLAQRSFELAVLKLRASYGSNLQNWEWGKVHQTTFPHLPFSFLNDSRLDSIFNSPAHSSRGGNFSIHTSSFRNSTFQSKQSFDAWIVANAQQVIDLNDFDQSIHMPSTGQVGHLFHSNRDDLTPLWSKGEFLPFSFSKTTVKNHGKQTLTLQPLQQP